MITVVSQGSKNIKMKNCQRFFKSASKKWITFAALLIAVTVFYNQFYFYGSSEIDTETNGTEISTKTLAAYQDDFRFVINQPNFCGKDAGSSIPLLIMVTSGADRFEHRSLGRSTWVPFARSKGCKVIFLLGSSNDTIQRQVQDENKVQRDLVQAAFVDSYWNLTLKSMAMLKWVRDFCPKVKFVLKSDDDVLPNMDTLMKFIRTKKADVRSIYGKTLIGKANVPDRSGKWKVTREEYPGDVYPAFTIGGSYMLTGDCAPLLYTAALKYPYFHLEDVFLTGVVAKDQSINIVHKVEFSWAIHNFKPCDFRKALTVLDFTIQTMNETWMTINDKRLVCSKKVG